MNRDLEDACGMLGIFVCILCITFALLAQTLLGLGFSLILLGCFLIED